MTASLEDLAQLMYESYESAAIKHGWFSSDYDRMSWMAVPEENKEAFRDAASAVAGVVQDEERAKHDPEAVQNDLRKIMRELGMTTQARSKAPAEVVRSEIIPRIRKLMQNGPESLQADLRVIASELGISVVGRNPTSQELVQNDIVPTIGKLKETLVEARSETNRVKQILVDAKAMAGKNYAEIKSILDEGRRST